MNPDLAIVVVTYNSADVVLALLDSLPAGLAGCTADVIVVDNGSQDTTAEVVAGRSDCRLIRSSNKGYSAGINLGVSQASPAPGILILNPDVRLLPGCVPALLATLEQSGTGIVAPKILTPAGAVDRTLRREPTLPRAMGLGWTGLPSLSESLDRDEDYLHEQVVDWAVGAALLVSSECHTDLGGWDESFFLYSEETDFCLRARDRGWATRYVPEAAVVHAAGASGRTHVTHAMQIVNRVRLYRRRHGAAAAWAYWALAVVNEVLWGLRGHRRSWSAVQSLLRPSVRPEPLNCSTSVLPV